MASSAVSPVALSLAASAATNCRSAIETRSMRCRMSSIRRLIRGRLARRSHRSHRHRFAGGLLKDLRPQELLCRYVHLASEEFGQLTAKPDERQDPELVNGEVDQ